MENPQPGRSRRLQQRLHICRSRYCEIVFVCREIRPAAAPIGARSPKTAAANTHSTGSRWPCNVAAVTNQGSQLTIPQQALRTQLALDGLLWNGFFEDCLSFLRQPGPRTPKVAACIEQLKSGHRTFDLIN